jgi:hypothetical protein
VLTIEIDVSIVPVMREEGHLAVVRRGKNPSSVARRSSATVFIAQPRHYRTGGVIFPRNYGAENGPNILLDKRTCEIIELKELPSIIFIPDFCIWASTTLGGSTIQLQSLPHLTIKGHTAKVPIIRGMGIGVSLSPLLCRREEGGMACISACLDRLV